MQIDFPFGLSNSEGTLVGKCLYCNLLTLYLIYIDKSIDYFGLEVHMSAQSLWLSYHNVFVIFTFFNHCSLMINEQPVIPTNVDAK